MDGKITVHSPDRYNELFKEDSDKRVTTGDGHAPSPIRASSTSPAVQMKRIEEWLSQKATRNAVSLPDDNDLCAIKEVCKSISDREKDLLTDLRKFLDSQEGYNQSKKEMLYKKWKERVFNPIHTRLSTHMDLSYPMLDSWKRELFSKYLAHTNKHCAFLDTMNKDEYDPLSWSYNKAATKVTTRPLDDPLLQQNRALETDRLVLTSCDVGLQAALSQKCLPLGREDTSALMWLAMQLVYIDSDVRKRSRQSMRGLRNVSHVTQGVGNSEDGARHIPHRKIIVYPKKPLKLEWKEPIQTIATINSDNCSENQGETVDPSTAQKEDQGI